MSDHSKQPGGVTRRGLFRTLGAATLVAGCVKQDPGSENPERSEAPELDDALGLTPAPLEFVLDGQPVQAEVEARTTLLELLRLDLDRTGTKVVCDRGACGACMVLVDGVPRNSCMMLAHDVGGSEVTTVAGLAEGEQLSALQLAFIEHDALQCGFCTSGMLISSTALLREGGPLTRGQVEDAIAGNLCRCGTYPHVVDAVLAVANGEGGRRQTELLQVKKGGA
ncbi:Carbon monoxide dehydrogenase small chain [Enhygromyxa salina]|uniref:Carbon monoxide dehydrogenase small chain n=1 Tax=Enhygromyxa salina TaxID=215803 RepID=A0A2S9YCJ1_9BACT|nr:(2Fe-2S)-binding protein [Enhygromyxa salina]PRQ02834.1 Carbon monoxide dehydrogenase small chain [Enhygromyxa salina]